MPDKLAFLPPKSRLIRLFANRKQQSLGVMYAAFCLQAFASLIVEGRVTKADNMFKLQNLVIKSCRACQGGFCASYV